MQNIQASALFSTFENSRKRSLELEYPYFYYHQLQTDNKLAKHLRTGYYFIKNVEDEINLEWTIYLKNANLPILEINSSLKKKYDLPQFFDNVRSLPFCLDKIKKYSFINEKYLVEVKTKFWCELYFINNSGNIVGEKKWFTTKTENGLYLQCAPNLNETTIVIDHNLVSREIDLRFGTYYKEIGIVGSPKVTRKIDLSQYGVVDLSGKILIDFKFDKYKVDTNSVSIEFIEYPFFECNLQTNKLQWFNVTWENYKKY